MQAAIVKPESARRKGQPDLVPTALQQRSLKFAFTVRVASTNRSELAQTARSFASVAGTAIDVVVNRHSARYFHEHEHSNI